MQHFDVKKLLIVIFLCIVVSVILYPKLDAGLTSRNDGFSSMINNKASLSPDKNWRRGSAPYSNNVVCSLKISSTASFDDEKLQAESSVDKNPTTLTFADLNTESPFIIGNYGDRQTLVKIDNGSTLYLLEETPFGNLNVFTLFRDSNVMILSKQYSLVGPFGLLMIGDCLSGV
jgi:hypothetical protein